MSAKGFAASDLQSRLDALPPERRKLLEQLLASQQVPELEAYPVHSADPPLSFAQERLWFLNQFAPDSTAYHLHVHIPLAAGVSLELWHRAFAEVVRRHDALRTCFPTVDGRPVQRVAAVLDLPCPEHDLRGLEEGNRRDTAQRIAREQNETPFDLSNGPLLRTAIVLFEHGSVFLLTMHHIVADAWSMDVLSEELQALYASFAAGRPSPLPPLRIQYADFARWQRDYLQGERLDRLVGFWRTRLEKAPRLEFPTDRPHTGVPTNRGDHRLSPLPEDLAGQLADLARQENATLFITLLAAFFVLLHRYTSQTDLVAGIPTAGRNRTEIEPLIGFFVNTVLVRCDVTAEEPFRELLRRVREASLEAFAHQDLPFEKLVAELQPGRDLQHNPFFQVTFQLLRSRDPRARASATMDEVGYRRESTNDVDFAFDVIESGSGLHSRVEYATDLFDAATMERLLDHWEVLLRSVTRDPSTPVGRLNLLPETERRLLVTDWNRTERRWPLEPWIETFDVRVREQPDHPAILAPGGALSYRELSRRVNRLAASLRAKGLAPERLVALQIVDPVETLCGVLAVWKAGGAWLYLDPELPPSRLDAILSDARPFLLLSDDHPWWRAALSEEADSDEVPSPAAAGHLAYVVYTSGSSGRPKGVAIEHRALANQMAWMRSDLPLSPADRVLQKYSFSFDAALAEALPALGSGASLVFSGSRGRDVDEVIGLIHELGVTHLDVVPSQLAVLLAHPGIGSCRSLRRIVCGGESLSIELVDRCLDILPLELYNAYGPSETTITAACWQAMRDPERRPPPIGQPIANLEAFVLDEHLEPVPIGAGGELCLAGEGLARGYLNDSELTSARFVPHPFKSGARLYRTGDRARFRGDGQLEFLGRLDQQVKLHGYRIELGEIEEALAAHPGVREAAVMLSQIRPPAPGDERSTTTVRRDPRFEVSLRLPEESFIRPPNASQRNWLLQRALDEFSDDLNALDELSARFVPGSAREEIRAAWRQSAAGYDGHNLVIEGQQVMQDWERPLMREMARVAAESHGDVLEVGFGMGISATCLQEFGVRSHTIVECNDAVLSALETWRQAYPGRTIRVLPCKWQEVNEPDASFDAILFDVYPTSEEEYLSDVILSVTYAASFFPTAARLLRPGGVFTYYTNEIDSLSRRHQRLLLRHFRSFSVAVEPVTPPQDCQYWWADSMAVVKAVV